MSYPTIKALLIFLIKTLIYAASVFYTTNYFTIDNLGTVILGVFILSLPIILCGIYGSTVRQIRRLTIFKERGILFRIVSSRFLKSILWILWALSTSFFMLLQFHIYSEWEWFFFCWSFLSFGLYLALVASSLLTRLWATWQPILPCAGLGFFARC